MRELLVWLSSVCVGGLVLGGVLRYGDYRGRLRRVQCQWSSGRGNNAGLVGGLRRLWGAVLGGVTQWWGRVRGEAGTGGDLPVVPAYLVASVVAYLRAGLPVETAWEYAFLDGSWQAPPKGKGMEILDDPRFAGVAASIRAAQRVALSIGVGLAEALEAIVNTLEEAEENARTLAVSVASSQATIRLLAVLPLGGLGIAWLLGVDPLGFFFTSVTHFLVGVAGFFLWFLGFVWVRRLVGRFRRLRLEVVDPVVVVRLFEACLWAGLAVPRSLEVVGAECGYPRLEVLARLFMLGARAEQVKEFLQVEAQDCLLAQHLGRAILPAWKRGSDPLATLELVVQRLRRERFMETQVGIQKLSVWLALPLGLCFLPAFICLGVVPVAWGVFLG